MHQKDRHQLFNPLGLIKCVSVCILAHVHEFWEVGGGAEVAVRGGQTSPSRLGPFGKRGWAKRQTAAIRERHWSKGNLDSGNGAICTEDCGVMEGLEGGDTVSQRPAHVVLILHQGRTWNTCILPLLVFLKHIQNTSIVSSFTITSIINTQKIDDQYTIVLSWTGVTWLSLKSVKDPLHTRANMKIP